MNVDPELDVERAHGCRIDPAECGQHCVSFVPGHQARDCEVDGQCCPQGDQKQSASFGEVSHLTIREASPAAVPLVYLGWRCVSTTPMSGDWYGDGCAYGSAAVGQPLNAALLYWNQSTPSVTGITGNCVSITCSILSTTWCCWAVVSAGYSLNSASVDLESNRE